VNFAYSLEQAVCFCVCDCTWQYCGRGVDRIHDSWSVVYIVLCIIYCLGEIERVKLALLVRVCCRVSLC
jgi:hypothetical protein